MSEKRRRSAGATSTVVTRAAAPGAPYTILIALAPSLRRRIGAWPARSAGFVDVELVRIHGALHDRLAETVRGRDEDDVAEARVGVEREHHTACAEIGAHHVLHAGRQRDQVVIEALVHAISNRAIVEQRREHLVHALQQRIAAAHVEERFLLAGEGRFGQIFGSRRGAHRDRDLASGAHALERFEDLLLERAAGTASRESTGGCGRRRSRASRRPRRRARPALSRCAPRVRSCCRKSRYACAVVAKPSGTVTPACARWLIISPSEEFLPPTVSTS